ncbi:hypothetical protein INR49_030204 [Caranx melampygus]|nr:hypothetical protein INR49_030204 [Caranx melampygus]
MTSVQERVVLQRRKRAAQAGEETEAGGPRMRLDSSSESCGADSSPGPDGNAEKSMWGLHHELKFADTFPPESVFAPETDHSSITSGATAAETSVEEEEEEEERGVFTLLIQHLDCDFDSHLLKASNAICTANGGTLMPVPGGGQRPWRIPGVWARSEEPSWETLPRHLKWQGWHTRLSESRVAGQRDGPVTPDLSVKFKFMVQPFCLQPVREFRVSVATPEYKRRMWRWWWVGGWVDGGYIAFDL